MDFKLIGLAGILSVTGCVGLNLDLGPGVQGSGKEATEHRDVKDFSKIDTHGAFDVAVKCGPSRSVEITGDDNLVKLVETTVEDGTLTLTSEKNLHAKKGLKVTITTPHLTSFSLKGAGDVSIDGVNEKDFTVDLKGAGDLTASGKADNLNVTLKGAGDVKMYDLHADNVTATLNGAGDLNVWASKYLSAKMSGAGDLSYKGHPAKVDKDKTGVGDISEAD